MPVIYDLRGNVRAYVDITKVCDRALWSMAKMDYICARPRGESEELESTPQRERGGSPKRAEWKRSRTKSKVQRPAMPNEPPKLRIIKLSIILMSAEADPIWMKMRETSLRDYLRVQTLLGRCLLLHRGMFVTGF